SLGGVNDGHVIAQYVTHAAIATVRAERHPVWAPPHTHLADDLLAGGVEHVDGVRSAAGDPQFLLVRAQLQSMRRGVRHGKLDALGQGWQPDRPDYLAPANVRDNEPVQVGQGAVECLLVTRYRERTRHPAYGNLCGVLQGLQVDQVDRVPAHRGHEQAV